MNKVFPDVVNGRRSCRPPREFQQMNVPTSARHHRHPTSTYVSLLARALTVASFGILAACSTPRSTISGEQAAAPTHVVLTPGDVIKVIFSGAPELNQSQKIRSDGKVSMPLIGEVSAARKTLPQLQAELIALYKPQLKYNDILVTLESGSIHIFVAGAVGRPGPLVLDRPTTLLQAIMEAGGPNQFANLRRVQIIRLVNGQERSEAVNLRPTLAGEATEPLYVRDGDVIRVPQSAF
jgi:protein involved in polysaccharide export with SLBB domain